MPDIDEILLDADERMDKAVEAYRHALDAIRTGRASTALVEHIHIEQYGQKMALNQIATDRKSTRLNSSHIQKSRMPSSA